MLSVKLFAGMTQKMLASQKLLAYGSKRALCWHCGAYVSDIEEPKGRAKGGKARMELLSPDGRREQARAAADARWKRRSILRATHDSMDHPLKIGDVEIDCYVLEDGTRVISQRSMIRAVSLTRGGARYPAEVSRVGAELPRFATQMWLKPFISNELELALSKPILFRAGAGTAYGYPATILADVCDAVLKARDANATGVRQAPIVQQADLLVRGFARVGIIALVDEATGYQNDRARDALAKILEAFIAKELQPYLPTFPADYFKEMFRIRGLPFPDGSVKRPKYFGVLTNDIVYKRLAPKVLDELKRVKLEEGNPRDKLFQRLTSNIGYPKLREHLGSVVTIMKLSRDWKEFMEKLDRIHTRYGDTIPLPLEYESEKDDGKGL
jgi:P63C domain